jgi:hypothetical protein
LQNTLKRFNSKERHYAATSVDKSSYVETASMDIWRRVYIILQPGILRIFKAPEVTKRNIV